jgi:hypothetical protein
VAPVSPAEPSPDEPPPPFADEPQPMTSTTTAAASRRAIQIEVIAQVYPKPVRASVFVKIHGFLAGYESTIRRLE